MDTDRFSIVKALFLVLTGIEPSERMELLETLLPDDAAGRRLVLEMLTAEECPGRIDQLVLELDDILHRKCD